MKQQQDSKTLANEISQFNSILKRNDGMCIVNLEDRTEWVIMAKDTADQFIKALTDVVNNVYDYAECKITNAETFDSGYSMEITASVFIEDKDTEVEFYIYHANKF